MLTRRSFTIEIIPKYQALGIHSTNYVHDFANNVNKEPNIWHMKLGHVSKEVL